MATYNKTGTTLTSGVPDIANKPLFGSDRLFVVENTIDLTDKVTADGELTTAAVIQCLPIAAGTLVMRVDIAMITAAVGTALDCTVGDGSAADGWDASVDLKGAANTITSSTVGTDTYAVAAAMGTVYTTGDTIDITIGTTTAITAGPKFRIMALCVKLL